MPNDDALPASCLSITSAISPAVLEVSPFSLAERTAFVGRETERASIRAAIDRALSGHGSMVMLAGGPAWARPASRWRWRTTRGAWASAAPSGTATKETNLFPFFLSSRSLKAIWHRRRAWMISAGIWGIMRPNSPRSRQACGEFFRIFRNHWICRRRSSAAICSRAFQRRWRARLEPVRSYDSRRPSLGRRILAGAFGSSGQSHRPASSRNHRDLSRRLCGDNPALVRTLEELIRMGIRPLKLSGLSKDAVAEMLNGLSQRQAPESLVSTIFEESQGNPFFVEEVYRHLIEEGKVLRRGRRVPH